MPRSSDTERLVNLLQSIRSDAGNASDGRFNTFEMDEAIRLARAINGEMVEAPEPEQRPLPFYLAPVVIPVLLNPDTHGNLSWVEPIHLIDITRDPKWEKVVGKDFQEIEDYWHAVTDGEAERQFRITNRDAIARIEDSEVQRFLSIYNGKTAVFYVTEWTEEPLL